MLELNQQYDHINLRIKVFNDNYQDIRNSYVHFQFDNHELSFRKFALAIDVTVQMSVSKENGLI
jgi:hypothetical protein